MRADKVATETIDGDNTIYVITDLARDDYEEYYNGFANRVLWPILHYHIDMTEFTRRNVSGYFRVNRHFANELAKILRPDDVVRVHDYHLIPIAAELRQRGHGPASFAGTLKLPAPAPSFHGWRARSRSQRVILQGDDEGLRRERCPCAFHREFWHWRR